MVWGHLVQITKHSIKLAKVLLYSSLGSFKRSVMISVDYPWCFTRHLSGLEHCLPPASSQGE